MFQSPIYDTAMYWNTTDKNASVNNSIVKYSILRWKAQHVARRVNAVQGFPAHTTSSAQTVAFQVLTRCQLVLKSQKKAVLVKSSHALSAAYTSHYIGPTSTRSLSQFSHLNPITISTELHHIPSPLSSFPFSGQSVESSLKINPFQSFFQV